MFSRRVRTVLGFALAVLALAGFLQVVGPRAVLGVVASANPLVLSVGGVAVVAAFFCWSEAYRQLLVAVGAPVDGGLRYRAAFLSGEFLKQVVPLGHSGGPVFVSYAVSSETDAAYEDALAAATVVEFVNVGSSLVLATAGLAAFLATRRGPLEGVLVGLLAGLVVGALALASIALLVHYRRRLVRAVTGRLAAAARATVGRLSVRLGALFAPDRIEAAFDGYYGAVDRVLTDRTRLARAGGFSLAGWALFLVPVYTSFLALGRPVPYALGLFLVPVISLVNVVPLPGGLGGFEIALATGVSTLVGYALPVATAGVLLYRLSNYWLVVVLGAVASTTLSVGLAGPPPLVPAADAAVDEADPADQPSSAGSK